MVFIVGITISALSGDNGILSRASEAKEETKIAEEKEQISLAQSTSILDNMGEFTTNGLRNELKKLAGEDNVTVTNAKDKEGDNVIKIHFKDTDHYYHVKNNNIGKLDDSYYAKEEITEVWAIYYPNGEESELVFNTTGNIDSNKTTTGEIGKWEISRSSFEDATQRGWNSYAGNIKTVTFEEKVVPKNTAYWFSGFSKLTNIINIENLNTSNVINMDHMFNNCHSLRTLEVSNFDTTNVTNMSGMFQFCDYITYFDLTKWNTQKVEDMSSMFYSCWSLEEVTVGENWKTAEKNTSMFGGTCKITDVTRVDL